MARSSTQVQLSQAVQTLMVHKEIIGKVLGQTGTGTSFDPSRTPSKEQRQQLGQAFETAGKSFSEEEIETLASIWPVYQQGYQDGQSS